MRHQQNFLFVFGLSLCATLSLSGCTEVYDAMPRPIKNSVVNMICNMHKDELKDDVELFSAEAWDFDRLTQKINANPKNAIVLRNRGRAYYWSQGPKNYDLALADYNKALSMEPKHAKWYDERSKILDSLDRDDEALKDADTAIRLDGGKTASYFANRGSIYTDLEQWEHACDDYAEAVKLEPRGYASEYATALLKCGRDNDAVKVLKQLIDKNDGENSYEPLISIYLRQGKFDLARNTVESWKSEAPGSAEALKNSAKLFDALGETKKAEAEYQQLIDNFNSEDADQYEWSDRADYFDKLKQPARAKEARRRALDLCQKDADGPDDDLETRAGFHDKLGESGKAKELRERDLEVSESAVQYSPDTPDYADAYHSRAISLERLGRNEDALRDFAHAINLKPDNSHYIGHHADRLNALKRYPESIAECKAALKKDAINPDGLILGSLAEASEKLGKHQDAVDYCNAWIKHANDSGTAYRLRAQAYEKLGKKELAKRDEILSRWFGCDENES